ncbi:MAG: hypothetical protein ACKN9U_16060 [Pirellulaceae bacterium]
MARTWTRARLFVLSLVFVVAIGSVSAIQIAKWKRWSELDRQLAILSDSTYLTTEGDRVITLNDDAKKTVTILELAAKRKRPVGISTGRLELRNLDVEALDMDIRIEDVFSVTVSSLRPIGFREARLLRQAFPNCSLWTFPRIDWDEAVRNEFEQFPRGSCVNCWDKSPPDVGSQSFTSVGNAGIAWLGK